MCVCTAEEQLGGKESLPFPIKLVNIYGICK